MAHTTAPDAARPYDALLLVSFGGPEQPEDVVPFLQNVTRGRGISDERLAEVGEHYFRFGGRSPINDQCRALVTAIEKDFGEHDLGLGVYWGNRNWDPYLTEAVAAMRADGVRRAACFVTSAYSSYSGCRQYRENLFDAVSAVGGEVPRLDKLRHYFNHPGFVRPFVDSTLRALDELRAADDARLVFVTHSIPTAMNTESGRSGAVGGDAYTRQHLDVSRAVADGVAAATGREREWDLVFCSRSGSPRVPWLEPDVNDHLEEIARSGTRSVVVIPVGFVSDHMEVVFDLDTEARQTADRLGVEFARAATPGVDDRFVTMIRELLLERAAQERGEAVTVATTGLLSPSWNVCPPGCCANAHGPRPALCGSDEPSVAP